VKRLFAADRAGMAPASIKAALSLAIFLFFAVSPLASQHFKPFSTLRALRTEHFEFIYSEASAGTARRLAERADAVYDRVSALTGIAVERVIPVVITSETDEHNGYMNPLPYPHIVIFDTPASLEWTVFTDSLEALFLHELTHAVTGATRDRAARVLNRVFGGWVTPAGLTAPWFMMEGAAVSFESLDGTGRANDPLVKQRLRQDIIENRFKTPFQAEGVWDLPPQGNVYYYYGGLFSAYLQKKYGMAKYGELWRAMGGGFYVSPFVYRSGFYDIFNRVYGVSIVDCWNGFKASLALDGVEENPLPAVYGGNALIKDIAAAAGKVFFIDGAARKIVAYDTATQKTKTAAKIDGTAYALDVSEDGERLLVSGYRRLGANAGQFSRAVAVEYRAKTGFRTGREWRGLYNARYFRDGVVALRSDTHNASLVYRAGGDKNGADEEILLRGSETLLFSNPSPLDDEWIAFTSAKNGVRELSLFNYKTQTVCSLRGDTEGEVELWRYMRGLRFSGGRLYFSYNGDDRMYKLASVAVNIDGNGVGADDDIGAATAYFSGEDFSGGVFYPVSSGGNVYYGAAFSVWDRIMAFPQSAAGFESSAAQVPLNMIPWPEDPVMAERRIGDAGGQPVPASKPYNPIKYFNPFNLWLPFPLVSPVTSSIFWGTQNIFDAEGGFGDLSLDGAGLFSFVSDPTDQNLIFIGAGYDFRHEFVPVSVTWMNFNFMLPVTMEFADIFTFDNGTPMRKTRAGIQASRRMPLWNERLSITATGMFSASWRSFDSSLRKTDSGAPYSWPVREEEYSVSGGLNFSNRVLTSWDRFGNGFSELFYVRKSLSGETSFPRFENVFTASLESPRALQSVPVVRNFAFQASLYGMYDREGANFLGHSSSYSSSAFDNIAPSEYSVRIYGYLYDRLAGGQFDFSPVSFEIQKNLSHLYFNRIFAGLGYRWLYAENSGRQHGAPAYDGGPLFLHSLLFSLGAAVSIVPITVLPLKLTFNLLGALKLSGADGASSAGGWHFGWRVSVSY
jgi:hypothetical protein